MTKDEIIKFVTEKNSSDPITWGDFKKLIVLEHMVTFHMANIPADLETIAMYTKLDEKDLKTVIDKMIKAGDILEQSSPLAEEKLLILNLKES